MNNYQDCSQNDGERLVPSPQYFAAVKRFRITWFVAKSVGRSPRIRHRNELIVKAWERAEEELRKIIPGFGNPRMIQKYVVLRRGICSREPAVWAT